MGSRHQTESSDVAFTKVTLSVGSKNSQAPGMPQQHAQPREIRLCTGAHFIEFGLLRGQWLMAMVRHLSGAMAMEPNTGGYLRCQPAWRLTESLRPMGPGLKKAVASSSRRPTETVRSTLREVWWAARLRGSEKRCKLVPEAFRV